MGYFTGEPGRGLLCGWKFVYRKRRALEGQKDERGLPGDLRRSIFPQRRLPAISGSVTRLVFSESLLVDSYVRAANQTTIRVSEVRPGLYFWRAWKPN